MSTVYNNVEGVLLFAMLGGVSSGSLGVLVWMGPDPEPAPELRSPS